MPDKAWKNRERLVAKFFGGMRNALSGINSKVTHSDVIHDNLFIECKLRAKHTAIKLWDDTKSLADKEKKTPVIALCEKNRPGFWIMVHSDDFDKIINDISVNIESFHFNKSVAKIYEYVNLLSSLIDSKTVGKKELLEIISGAESL